DASDAFLLDVREPKEVAKGCVENAVNIPLGQLRERITELPRDREIWTYCFVGQRSYFAQRMLDLHGYTARSVSGGFLMYKAVKKVTS
ncbi:MAG: CoA-disulfide reductase, partial [Deltaproteobacteria bacterium]|nr:CoA-disulfide reductase [Deltaproteobacteria bacterium]